MKKLLQEYIKLQISKILSEGFYENPMTTIQDILDSFKDRTLIFFDTETTGLSATQDFSQVTEIGAVAFNEKKETLGEYHRKIELNSKVLSRIRYENEKKEKQKEINSIRKQLLSNKIKLKELESVVENIGTIISDNEFQEKKQLNKLKNDLNHKITTINNILIPQLEREFEEEKKLKKEKKEESKNISKTYIEDEISKIISSNTNSKSTETLKNLLNDINVFIDKISQEDTWQSRYQSIEDVLALTGYFKTETPVQMDSEKKVLSGFKEFIMSYPNPILIAHNASFDMKQINEGMKRNKLGVLPKMQVLDTRTLKDYIAFILSDLQKNKEKGNLEFDWKKLIVSLSYSKAEIEKEKIPDIKAYKDFIDKQNIDVDFLNKNLNKISFSLQHLIGGLDVKLENWHSAIEDAKALVGILFELRKLMEQYQKLFKAKAELMKDAETRLQQSRSKKIGVRRTERQKDFERNQRRKTGTSN